MKGKGENRFVRCMLIFAITVISSCLLSARYLKPEAERAVLAANHLDPAFNRYMAGHVGTNASSEEKQMLLLSDLTMEETTEMKTEEMIEATEEGGAIQTALSLIGAQYSLEQLSEFDFLVNHFYTVHNTTTITPEQLKGGEYLAKDLTLTVDPSAPQVLIYHTHYSEMYADSVPGDLNTGVIGVGNYLKELLTARYGLNVIHDTTPYEYNNSYSLAEVRVREILEAYPSIQVVIDLHRDAVGAQKLVTTINGKSTAKLMFFNGMCQTTSGPLPHLTNPYLEDNLALSLQMKLVAEAYYPGLTRKNYLKPYQYNLHLRPLSTLIEVGADSNTFEEAKNAMEPLADILGKVLVKK